MITIILFFTCSISGVFAWYFLGKLSKEDQVSFLEHSELSNPRIRRKKPRILRSGSNNQIAKKLLEDHEDARDDKELFISLVQCYNEYSFSKLEWFSRAWRYVQQHYPELRGKEWNKRQREADLIRKNI